jgi:hypothetical protein
MSHRHFHTSGLLLAYLLWPRQRAPYKPRQPHQPWARRNTLEVLCVWGCLALVWASIATAQASPADGLALGLVTTVLILALIVCGLRR